MSTGLGIRCPFAANMRSEYEKPFCALADLMEVPLWVLPELNLSKQGRLAVGDLVPLLSSQPIVLLNLCENLTLGR